MTSTDYAAWGVGIAGGVMISLVTLCFTYGSGNLIGVSGILHGIIRPWSKEFIPWKSFFIAGVLIAGSSGYAILSLDATSREARNTVFGPDQSNQPLWVCLLSGICVGFGASMSNGCTSGHGLVGVSRLSPRSIVATGTFFCTGIITASLTLSSFGAPIFHGETPPSFTLGSLYVIPLVAVLVFHVIMVSLFSKSHIQTICPPDFSMWITICKTSWHIQLFSLLMGFLFGVALLLTGMCNPDIIAGFLNFGSSQWNPQLLLVCVGCMIPNVIGFYYVAHLQQPPYLVVATVSPAADSTAKATTTTTTGTGTGTTKNLCDIIAYGPKHPKNNKIEWRLIVGAIIFGFGWSLSGICPGPGLINYATGRDYYGVLVPSMIFGMQIHDGMEEVLIWVVGFSGKTGNLPPSNNVNQVNKTNTVASLGDVNGGGIGENNVVDNNNNDVTVGRDINIQ
jgi:uncharacterized membrane protein YedE/YeeE